MDAKAEFQVCCENCYDQAKVCIYTPWIIGGEVKIRCPTCNSTDRQTILR